MPLVTRPVDLYFAEPVNIRSDQYQGLLDWWPLIGPQGKVIANPISFRHQRAQGVTANVGARTVFLDPGFGQLTYWNGVAGTGQEPYGYQVGGDALNLKDNFSVAVWFYPENANTYTLYAKNFAQVEQPATGYAFQANASGQLSLSIKGSADYASVGVPTQNQWNHAVWTLRPSGSTWVLSYYLNGQFIDTDSVTSLGNRGGNNVARIGSQLAAIGGITAVHKGLIADVRTYGKTLNATEVLNLYSEHTRWELYNWVSARRLSLRIPAPPLQTVQPDSITSAEAVSNPSVVQVISPDSITSAEAFGSPTLTTSATVAPTSIDSAESVGSPSVVMVVQPESITTAESVGNPTLTTSATIAPTSIDSAESVGSPTLVMVVQPESITTAESVGNPTLTASNTIAPDSITTAESVGSPSVVQVISVDSITTGEAFGSPTLTTSATIQPDSITSAESLGSPTLVMVVQPESITTAESVGQPTLTSSATVAPTSIGTGEAFGSPTITTSATIAPTSIDSAESVASPTVSTVVSILPDSITSAEAVPNPTLTATATITPDSVGTGEAFGTPTVQASNVIIPEAIGSGEAFGTPTVTPVASIFPSSIDSAETVPSPTLTASNAISPTSISSAESFGTPTLSTSYVITPDPIGSEEDVSTGLCLILARLTFLEEIHTYWPTLGIDIPFYTGLIPESFGRPYAVITPVEEAPTFTLCCPMLEELSFRITVYSDTAEQAEDLAQRIMDAFDFGPVNASTIACVRENYLVSVSAEKIWSAEIGYRLTANRR